MIKPSVTPNTQLIRTVRRVVLAVPSQMCHLSLNPEPKAPTANALSRVFVKQNKLVLKPLFSLTINRIPLLARYRVPDRVKDQTPITKPTKSVILGVAISVPAITTSLSRSARVARAMISSLVGPARATFVDPNWQRDRSLRKVGIHLIKLPSHVL